MKPTQTPEPMHRSRGKSLGLLELIAIALGGMVGGGIFTVLGVSAALIGAYTPLAIAMGAILAALAAYSYIKLGVYFKDEGATYAFYKRTYPKSPFAAAVIGWWVVFGYISTIALYAYTFSSYALSNLTVADNEWLRKLVAILVIGCFTAVNVWSVKGMGRLEDLMVYTKLVLLVVISFTLINHSNTTLPTLIEQTGSLSVLSIAIIASLTFVAYEGFQLVINATNEMHSPEKNIPRAIYIAIALAATIYIVISLGAILAIPMADIIEKQEYALASGANGLLGHWGSDLVIAGALLATCSAISGTLFGASRQMAVIASDGYLPQVLATRQQTIPVHAILLMSLLAAGLILIGNLVMILEFGSITFLMVSLLMAIANFKLRRATASSTAITVLSIISLLIALGMIIAYDISHRIEQLYFTAIIFATLTLLAFAYSRRQRQKS